LFAVVGIGSTASTRSGDRQYRTLADVVGSVYSFLSEKLIVFSAADEFGQGADEADDFELDENQIDEVDDAPLLKKV
jgi:hypothetical protein